MTNIETKNEEQCPRCGGPLRRGPDDLGALSRYDNATVICHACGEGEALLPAFAGALHPVTGERPWARWL